MTHGVTLLTKIIMFHSSLKKLMLLMKLSHLIQKQSSDSSKRGKKRFSVLSMTRRLVKLCKFIKNYLILFVSLNCNTFVLFLWKHSCELFKLECIALSFIKHL
ncbi:hypothetical protein ACKWTF_009596 [Chironomus riparius]